MSELDVEGAAAAGAAGELVPLEAGAVVVSLLEDAVLSVDDPVALPELVDAPALSPEDFGLALP